MGGFFLDSNFSNLKIEDNKNISDSYNSFFADFFDKNQKENLKKNDQISVKKGEIGFENTDLSTKSYADFNLLGKTISFTNSLKKDLFIRYNKFTVNFRHIFRFKISKTG